MSKPLHFDLSRRERQIMDILYRRKSADAAEVLAELPDPPSYSAVRALLRILEEKGIILHTQEGRRYVYRPVESRERAGRSSVSRLLDTFFSGSVEDAVAAMLDARDEALSEEELDRLKTVIECARREGRRGESSREAAKKRKKKNKKNRREWNVPEGGG